MLLKALYQPSSSPSSGWLKLLSFESEAGKQSNTKTSSHQGIASCQLTSAPYQGEGWELEQGFPAQIGLFEKLAIYYISPGVLEILKTM